MFDMGFLPSVKRILKLSRRRVGKRCYFPATFPGEIEELLSNAHPSARVAIVISRPGAYRQPCIFSVPEH